jgi:O-antigen/teichoic acid export membrane protein
MEGELLADQPLGQKLIKKGFWLYFFTIITAPVGYIIKMIVSNTLSVEDVGIFYSVLGFI